MQPGYSPHSSATSSGRKPRAKNALVAAIIGGVAVVAIGATALIAFLSGDDTPSRASGPGAGQTAGGVPGARPGAKPPASNAPNAPQVKGPADKFKDAPHCADITAKVPNLPPVNEVHRALNEGTAYPEFDLECVFRSPAGASDDLYFDLKMTLYLTDKNGTHPGVEEAASYFQAGISNGNEEASGLGIGNRAAWTRKVLDLPENSPTECPLTILDGNALIEVSRSGATDPTNQTKDRASEVCRTPTKELTQQLVGAVQPGR